MRRLIRHVIQAGKRDASFLVSYSSSASSCYSIDHYVKWLCRLVRTRSRCASHIHLRPRWGRSSSPPCNIGQIPREGLIITGKPGESNAADKKFHIHGHRASRELVRLDVIRARCGNHPGNLFRYGEGSRPIGKDQSALVSRLDASDAGCINIDDRRERSARGW